MLTVEVLEQVLAGIPALRIGVVGDLFLDRYLDLDGTRTELSLETGLDAYQVTRVRSCPGAAGTVINNLAALGVGQIDVISATGDDGEGYELRQALRALPGACAAAVCVCRERRTPTYMKPMLSLPDAPPRELNRLDIKNRVPVPAHVERHVLQALDELWPRLDALLVLDQVSEPECGVITSAVRERIALLGASAPDRLILADSRGRIGLFRNCCLKPNERECRDALGIEECTDADLLELARRAGRTVFCTRGERGMVVADPRRANVETVPGVEVAGPIDTVGAGDSSSAALACALGQQHDAATAAAFANLVASITIRQLGTTGTATPQQVREHFAMGRR